MPFPFFRPFKRPSSSLSHPATPPPQPETPLIFDGKNADECESFIREVRARAHRAGKAEDARWMIALATSSLAGNALGWHLNLPAQVQNDWALFQRAMLDEYCTERPSVDGAMVPTPAPPAAPPPPAGALRFAIRSLSIHFETARSSHSYVGRQCPWAAFR